MSSAHCFYIGPIKFSSHLWSLVHNISQLIAETWERGTKSTLPTSDHLRNINIVQDSSKTYSNTCTSSNKNTLFITTLYNISFSPELLPLWGQSSLQSPLWCRCRGSGSPGKLSPTPSTGRRWRWSWSFSASSSLSGYPPDPGTSCKAILKHGWWNNFLQCFEIISESLECAGNCYLSF